MVLDIYDNQRDVLIFKNTYDDPENGLTKKFEIQRTDPNAPTELYFVHIEVENMANLPSQKERRANKMQEKTIRQKSHTLPNISRRKKSGESSSESKNAKAPKLDKE